MWLQFKDPCVCLAPKLKVIGAHVDRLYHDLCVVCAMLAIMIAAGLCSCSILWGALCCRCVRGRARSQKPHPNNPFIV